MSIRGEHLLSLELGSLTQVKCYIQTGRCPLLSSDTSCFLLLKLSHLAVNVSYILSVLILSDRTSCLLEMFPFQHWKMQITASPGPRLLALLSLFLLQSSPSVLDFLGAIVCRSMAYNFSGLECFLVKLWDKVVSVCAMCQLCLFRRESSNKTT